MPTSKFRKSFVALKWKIPFIYLACLNMRIKSLSGKAFYLAQTT